MSKIAFKILFFISILSLANASLHAQELAFHGAKGFGKYTVGGKFAPVYRVDTLVDNDRPGSLRYGINLKHPRQIHFDVSGVIKLNAPLKIKHGNLSILGQTSPGGIAIVGAPVSIRSEQVIIQHLRIRLGTYGQAEDALTVRNSKNIIIDHCSFSWGIDETASLYRNENLTLQNSIISNSLNDSIHPKGKHGYGGIWGGANVSFIGNLIANHRSRTPRINGHRLNSPYPMAEEYVELVNNVIFNWGINSVYGNENGRLNLINNYYLPGPDTKKLHFFDQFYSDKNSASTLYIAGNIMHNKSTMNADNHKHILFRNSKGNTQDKAITAAFRDRPNTPNETAVSAKEILDSILATKNIGAYLIRDGRFHDSVDQRVINQVLDQLANKNSQSLIIDHESQHIIDLTQYQAEFQGLK